MKRKDEYIAILAHELRNPLSAIHNAVLVMQLPDASSEQQAWAQELLQRQVKHLTCLMDDLLDVSRISNGRIQLHQEVVDLGQVVGHAAETLAPLLNKHHHSLNLQLPEQPVYVNGDTVRLTQILGNLLTNAAKYMDDGGSIDLIVERADADTAVIRVRDRGVGIPSELLTKVFDLFVQAPTALNRAQGGLGIGLALVRALVELHGGSTYVTSEGPGQGAEFSVKLPLVDGLPQYSALPNFSAAPGEALLKVLVIDDNVDSANGLSLCLESHGYVMRIAHAGKEGVAAALDYVPDVVLLDIGLPDIDGCEVARRLRREATLDDLYIVAMTGYGGDADRNRAELAGFNHYLVKPVDLSELLGLLAARIDQASAIQDGPHTI